MANKKERKVEFAPFVFLLNGGVCLQVRFFFVETVVGPDNYIVFQTRSSLKATSFFLVYPRNTKKASL